MSKYNVVRIHRDLGHRFILYDWRVSLTTMTPGERLHFEIPHSLVTISDTITPPAHLLLRSEVLLAAKVLREALAQACWIQHSTHPVGASTNF